MRREITLEAVWTRGENGAKEATEKRIGKRGFQEIQKGRPRKYGTSSNMGLKRTRDFLERGTHTRVGQEGIDEVKLI